MLTVFVLLAAVPFVALADWFNFIKRLPPREQNLARASHGAGMLAFAVLALVMLDRIQGIENFKRDLAAHPKEPTLWGPALAWGIVVVWGVGWLLIGSSRSRGPRDALLISRAVVKIAVGVVAGVLARGPGYVPREWFGETFARLIELALIPFAVWCVVTGATKLVLLMRGAGGSAAGLVDQQIQRTSIFWRIGRRRKF